MKEGLVVWSLLILIAIILGAFCGCSQKPPDGPADGWADFRFEYYYQGNYNAFPKGLSHVQDPYDHAYITLQKWDVQFSPPPERIPAVDYRLGDYMRRYYRVDSLQHQNHANRHLFAIEALLDPDDTTKTLPALGIALTTSDRDSDWACFVAVHTAESTFSAQNENEVISHTTTHELCHLIASSDIVDCRDSPGTHDGACLMMDIGERSVDMTLLLGCVDTEYPYRHNFCDPCVTGLKNEKYRFRKP